MVDLSSWGYEQGSPVNDKESDLIKEYTPEEIYYGIDELSVPEHCEIYIAHLEREIAKLNAKLWDKRMAENKLRNLIDYANGQDNTYLSNELTEIKKLLL